MAVMTTSYHLFNGIQNILTVSRDDLVECTVGKDGLEVTFGDLSEVRMVGFISSEEVERDYISKEKLKDQLLERRSVITVWAEKAGADKMYLSANNYIARAAELNRLIGDIEIDEIDVP